MTVWHRLSTVFWEEVELFKLVTTCYGNVHRQKGPTIIAAFAASDRSYHHLKIRRLSQVSHRVRCHDIFFLFSKCLICLTHSHNASAVSLIFFCDSEYDQSLVLRSRFPVWSAPRTSRYLRMTKSDPCRRDWNMIILFIFLLRQCRKCSTEGKSLIFF